MATDASRNLTSTIGDGSNDLQTLALQRYFSKELLNTIEQTLVLDQFATKQPLPEKSGSKTMRFFRYQRGMPLMFRRSLMRELTQLLMHCRLNP